jgi:hypothetical protein
MVRARRKIIIATGALFHAFAFAPAQAWAHDGLGGDELAVANWMLIGAILTVVMGLLAGVWAWRNGQFSNIEGSKYSMLELSEDYDRIMAEAEEAERLEQERAAKTQAVGAKKSALSTGESHALPK